MIEPELFNFKPPLNKHGYVQKHWDKLLANVDECGLTHSVSILMNALLLYHKIINYCDSF